MKELFEEVLKMDDVRGLLFLSPEGAIRFSSFVQDSPADPRHIDWLPQLLEQLASIREAEFLYEWSRLYIRNGKSGVLLIWAKLNANMAMIRLNCDVSLTNWEQSGQSESRERKRSGFFRRRG
jgi:hypothetical protein